MVAAEEVNKVPGVYYKELAKQYHDFKYTDYWSYPFLWAINDGIITGYQQTQHPKTKKVGNWLNPNGNLTEYHMLTILLRYFKSDELNNILSSEGNNIKAVYKLVNKYNLNYNGTPFQFSNADNPVDRGALAETLVSLHYGENKSLNESIEFMYKNGLATGYSDKNGKYPKTFASYGIKENLRRGQIVSLLKNYDDFINNMQNLSSENFEVWPIWTGETYELNHPTTGKSISLDAEIINIDGPLIFLQNNFYGVNPYWINSDSDNPQYIRDFAKLNTDGSKSFVFSQDELLRVVTDGKYFYIATNSASNPVYRHGKITRYDLDGMNPKVLWENTQTFLADIYFYNNYLYFNHYIPSENGIDSKYSVVERISTTNFEVEEVYKRDVSNDYRDDIFKNDMITVETKQLDKPVYFYDMKSETFLKTKYPKIEGYKMVDFYYMRGSELILGYSRHEYLLDITKEKNFIILSYNPLKKEIKRIANGALSNKFTVYEDYIEYIMEDGSKTLMYY